MPYATLPHNAMALPNSASHLPNRASRNLTSPLPYRTQQYHYITSPDLALPSYRVTKLHATKPLHDITGLYNTLAKRYPALPLPYATLQRSTIPLRCSTTPHRYRTTTEQNGTAHYRNRALHNIAVALPNAAPRYLTLAVHNWTERYHHVTQPGPTQPYLYLMRSQVKLPLPALRHCPSPLNSP